MELKSINRWIYYNVDRIEEILETNKKAIIILAGASSSGKSHSAKILKQALLEENYNATILSTDNYNKGISGIITDKVNEKYFSGQLKNIEKIKHIVKKCIINTDFLDKFNDNDLKNIKRNIKGLIDKNYIDLFIKSLKQEFSIINFDEPSVYDLVETANDLKKLIDNDTILEKKYSKIISERQTEENKIDGSKIDVVIVEGIYALEDDLIKNLPQNIVVTNFIEGDAKSLFLRRVLRDAKTTSADNNFTIKAYFKYIVPSYLKDILSKKQTAECVLKNNITFKELRDGTLYATKEKVQVSNKNLILNILKSAKVLSKEKQRDIYFCSKGEEPKEENLLRLRTIFDEDKQKYIPTSLVHKGAIKNRSDNKIVRPINILIKEGDFFKIFNSEEDFLNEMDKAQFKIDRETYKTRTRLLLNNQNLIFDDIKDEGLFIEFSDNNNPIVINKIKELATKQTTTKKITKDKSFDKQNTK